MFEIIVDEDTGERKLRVPPDIAKLTDELRELLTVVLTDKEAEWPTPNGAKGSNAMTNEELIRVLKPLVEDTSAGRSELLRSPPPGILNK